MGKKLISLFILCAMLIGTIVPVAIAGVPTTYVVLPKGSTSLFVRSGPSTNYRAIGVVKNGDMIDILKVGATWTRIRTVSKNITGYIMNRYIDELPGDNHPPRVGKATAARVTGRGVNLRRNAGTKYAVVWTAPFNTKLMIWGSKGNWYYVTTLDGKSGWISKTYVKKNYTTYTTVKVNFRKSPNGTIIKALPKGTTVTAISIEDGWTYAKVGTKYGYVYNEYLKN